ncbi:MULTISPECIES: DUF3231 family protein [Bacillaceae]|uniref:DUF3231 family protein n=1 Tax=Bacillaceae TaxID=186817 RepID=UPI00101B8E0A|nr:DUF3231 family protein [Bacillus infantis]MCA1035163.1 DUF3231 family protein [Bacillus infantis]MDW2877824.1 DUF3231 family protein [Bacillus infantis]RYI29491.1 DUF3231 family protein [Bacillus infantis]
MENHRIRLTASETGGLWANYIADSMFTCVYKYYLACVEDSEIKAVLAHALDLSEQHMKVTSDIFREEGHAVPIGFTAEDVHPNAPRLFSDEFFLFYTEQMAKGALVIYGGILPHTYRNDIREHFMSCISSTMELMNETKKLLLSKGLEVRSPYIPPLTEAVMVEDQHFLAGWFGRQRPLTAAEISHLFANIQTNYFGCAVVLGFAQTAKKEDVKDYMMRGKEIATKHSRIFSRFLQEEDLPAPVTWDAEISESQAAPFSDKLMMFQVNLMSASGIGNYGTALSASPRRDIAGDYSRLLAEVGLYAEDGLQILIKHGWLERPPHAADRNELVK